MSINQKQKGKRIERLIAAWLREEGASSARRTNQFCGTEGTSDVCAEELKDWHIESKGTKNPSVPLSTINKWLNQVISDAPVNVQPVIIHVPNGAGEDASNWTAIVPVLPKETFARFVMQLDAEYSKSAQESYNFGQIISLSESMDWLEQIIDDVKHSRPLDGSRDYKHIDRVVMVKTGHCPAMAMRATVWFRAAMDSRAF